MRVAAFTDLTGPDGVEILERPDPEPGAGEAVVDVDACAINRHDLWILEGDSAMVDPEDLPFLSGLDVAGVVRAVGPDVTVVEPGDHVLLCPIETCGTCRFCREGPENACEALSLYHGGLATRACVDASRLVHLPDGVDSTTAAALPTAYMTAYHMLHLAEVQPGDSVLVPGASGGVGVACVQLAELFGASTIGTSSSSTKLDALASLGLDHGIQGTERDALREEILAIGRPDAVMNHLGGEFTGLGMDVLRRGGRMVHCGRTAGRHSEITITDLYRSMHRLIGSMMGTQVELERLVALVAATRLEPEIEATYGLEDTADAFARMQDREAVGKIIVTN